VLFRSRWRVPAAVLAAMAVIAVGAYAWWGEQAGWDGGRAMTAEEAAQEIMLRGMRAIAAAREAAGFPIDRRIDPNGTGLIGVEIGRASCRERGENERGLVTVK